MDTATHPRTPRSPDELLGDQLTNMSASIEARTALAQVLGLDAEEVWDIGRLRAAFLAPNTNWEPYLPSVVTRLVYLGPPEEPLPDPPSAAIDWGCSLRVLLEYLAERAERAYVIALTTVLLHAAWKQDGLDPVLWGVDPLRARWLNAVTRLALSLPPYRTA